MIDDLNDMDDLQDEADREIDQLLPMDPASEFQAVPEHETPMDPDIRDEDARTAQRREEIAVGDDLDVALPSLDGLLDGLLGRDR